MLRYIYYWELQKKDVLPKNQQYTTTISIVIPARNEAHNITACIQSILQQSYPSELVEIIVVDDHSEDNTKEKVIELSEQANIRLLELKDFIQDRTTISFKKKALTYAVQQAKGELIVCTDADCISTPTWLEHLAYTYQKKGAAFIAAPVQYHDEQSGFERFQSLDFLGMMIVTAAGIQGKFMYMCNGANLAYPKQVFQAVNGFEGVDHLASGDDIFLMHKILKQYPEQVYFIKSEEASVYTKGISNLSGFIQQRIRWSTKNASYEQKGITWILALVWFFHLSLLSTIIATLFFTKLLALCFIQILSKGIIDFIFLSKVSRFFKRQDLMKSFMSASTMHLLYITSIGLLANISKKYHWKGRRVQ